jgi:hypothetical protein
MLDGSAFRAQANFMAGLSSLLADAVAEFAAEGVRLTARPGECCVSCRNGSAMTAYVTADHDDTVEHGRDDLARAADPPTETVPPVAWHWRRPLRMTPRARRRRAICRHNQRRRARMLREQRAASEREGEER